MKLAEEGTLQLGDISLLVKHNYLHHQGYLYKMSMEEFEIYTDGSCHTQRRIGAWVAILFFGQQKNILSGVQQDTTHNRMELLAVIEAIEYIQKKYPASGRIKIYTDSQYVTGLVIRREKLIAAGFITGNGNPLQNADLVKAFLNLPALPIIELIKVKAHQRQTGAINYNREADILARKLVRGAVEGISI